MYIHTRTFNLYHYTHSTHLTPYPTVHRSRNLLQAMKKQLQEDISGPDLAEWIAKHMSPLVGEPVFVADVVTAVISTVVLRASSTGGTQQVRHAGKCCGVDVTSQGTLHGLKSQLAYAHASSYRCDMKPSGDCVSWSDPMDVLDVFDILRVNTENPHRVLARPQAVHRRQP